MIGRIVIENYKSIESLTLDLGRVTVLVGANGSGKSNILEAIALCSAAAANKLDNEFLFARGIRVSDDPRHMRSAFSQNAKNQIDIRVELSAGVHLYDVSLLLYLNSPSFISKSDSQVDIFNAILHSDLYPRNRAMSDEDISDYSSRLKIASAKQQEYFHEKGLLNFLPYTPENSALRRFEDEGQIQPLGIRGEGLFKLLTVLARPENADRLAELQERLQLLDWFGGFEIGGNVSLGERTLRIRDQYLDGSGDLSYFSQRSANEGFLFLLFYFALFVAKETPRFFAVDNIDASLNPKLCAELTRQLCELAAKYDKQVILTTHNPAILDGLDLRDDNQRLYVVERDLDGRTQARRVPAPRPPEKHEEPTPLSEAFGRGYIGGLPKNF